MELQQPPQTPQEKISLIQKIENHIEHPLKLIDKTTLPLEEDIIEKILKSPNTEKLIEYTINNPRTKKICEDITEQKLQEFRKDVARECKKLEDNFSHDFKQITHNVIYFGIGVTIVAILLIAAYSH